MCGALANQLFVLAAGLTVDLGAQVFVFSTQGQVLDALGHGNGGGRQTGEGLQGIQLQALELPGGEGVEGDQAPRAFIDHQWAAHAVVHFKVGIRGVDQAIVGVGQFGVAGKPGGFRSAEQNLEPRMLTDPESAAQGVGAQAVHSQGYQPFTVQAQQRSGVARQQAAHGLQQAAVALLIGQIAGQITDEGQQGGQQRLVVILTPVGPYDYTSSRVILTWAASNP